MPELPAEAVQAAASPVEIITNALLRWSADGVSRHAGRIAEAAVKALADHGYPVELLPSRRTVRLVPTSVIQTATGRTFLTLACPCCGYGEVSLDVSPELVRTISDGYPKEDNRA